MGAGINGLDAGQLGGKTGAVLLAILVGRQKPEQRGDGERRDGQAERNFPTAGNAQRQLQRLGGRQRAQAAGGHDPASQRGLPFRRKPLGESLERGHQAGRNAEADQRAPHGEATERVGQRKNRRAAGGNDEQRRFHPARAEAVEQHAERQLGGAKGEEIGAGQQAERVVAEIEFAGEHRADDGIGRAIQVREEIAGGKRQKQPNPQAAGVDVRHCGTTGQWGEWNVALDEPGESSLAIKRV